MVYAVKKKVNGSIYYYAVISVRVKDKVKLKTIKFLGKEDDLSKNQVKILLSKISKKEIEGAKAEVKSAGGIKQNSCKKKKPKSQQKPATSKDIIDILKKKKMTLEELKKAIG